jgi:hypothetical protein
MKHLKSHTTKKGNRYDLVYYEDIKKAKAIGALPRRVGAVGSVEINTENKSSDEIRKELIAKLEEGEY